MVLFAANVKICSKFTVCTVPCRMLFSYFYVAAYCMQLLSPAAMFSCSDLPFRVGMKAQLRSLTTVVQDSCTTASLPVSQDNSHVNVIRSNHADSVFTSFCCLYYMFETMSFYSCCSLCSMVKQNVTARPAVNP